MIEPTTYASSTSTGEIIPHGTVKPVRESRCHPPCRIFARRLEINPSCIKLTAALVPKLHWLPMQCGYRCDLTEVPRKRQRRRR